MPTGQSPGVLKIVSLTKSLIKNLLSLSISPFSEKKRGAFALQKRLTFIGKNGSVSCTIMVENLTSL